MSNTKLPHPQKCALYHDLWTNRSWVHRRIDEISFTERGMMQVKSTFDLDIAYLKKKISTLPKKLHKDDHIELPLMALPRTLILDIDVTLDGKAQSFGSTETSAYITHCIYLQEYFSKHIADINHCSKGLLTNKWPSEYFDEMEYVSDFICHWFEKGSSRYAEERLKDITNQLNELKKEIKPLQKKEEAGEDISQNINTLHEKLMICNRELLIMDNITCSAPSEKATIKPYRWEQWSRFSKDYIAVVLIDIPSNRRRAKLTYETKIDIGYQGDAFLPIRTSAISIGCWSLLGSGAEERYHFRINAPDGHYISSLRLADARNNNNEVAFRQPNAPVEEDSFADTNDTKSVTCVAADGADLTFLEIKDNTPQGKGNMFGHTLNIGVEPFPRTFISRAHLGIVFLIAYLLISRFITFDIGRIIPFSVAALGFLASSPLWFRIGSEDSFTHHTLKKGRKILVNLAAVVFATSFINHLVNWQIRLTEADEDPAKCSFAVDEHAQIINEQYICGISSAFSNQKTQNIIDNWWEVVLLSCFLYLLGVWWFFIRTHIQKKEFKIFLEQINSVPFSPRESTFSQTDAARSSCMARFLLGSILVAICFIIFLIFSDCLFIVSNLPGLNWMAERILIFLHAV